MVLATFPPYNSAAEETPLLGSPRGNGKGWEAECHSSYRMLSFSLSDLKIVGSEGATGCLHSTLIDIIVVMAEIGSK
jgi:hypothetical protein